MVVRQKYVFLSRNARNVHRIAYICQQKQNFMEENFDYSLVPSHFIHCFHTSCPRAGECLRQLAARHVTAVRPTLLAVNPAVWADCSLFVPIRPIRVAWGVRNRIDRMPHKEAEGMNSWLNRTYSRMGHSRIVRHLKPLLPADQKLVLEAFHRFGVMDEDVFDYYTYTYDWNAKSGK